MKLPGLLNGFTRPTLEREPSRVVVEVEEDPDSAPAEAACEVEDVEDVETSAPDPAVVLKRRRRAGLGRSGTPSENILSYDAAIGAAYDTLRAELGRIPLNREVASSMRWREALGLTAQVERVRMALRRLGREANRSRGPLR